MFGEAKEFVLEGRSEKFRSNLGSMLEVLDSVQYKATGAQEDYNSDEEEVAVMDPRKWNRDSLAGVPDTTMGMNRRAALQAQAVADPDAVDPSTHAPSAEFGSALVCQSGEGSQCFIGRRRPVQRPRGASATAGGGDVASRFRSLADQFQQQLHLEDQVAYTPVDKKEKRVTGTVVFKKKKNLRKAQKRVRNDEKADIE